MHLEVKSEGKNHKCVTEISVNAFLLFDGTGFWTCGLSDLHSWKCISFRRFRPKFSHFSNSLRTSIPFHRFLISDYWFMWMYRACLGDFCWKLEFINVYFYADLLAVSPFVTFAIVVWNSLRLENKLKTNKNLKPKNFLTRMHQKWQKLRLKWKFYRHWKRILSPDLNIFVLDIPFNDN